MLALPGNYDKNHIQYIYYGYFPKQVTIFTLSETMDFGDNADSLFNLWFEQWTPWEADMTYNIYNIEQYTTYEEYIL